MIAKIKEIYEPSSLIFHDLTFLVIDHFCILCADGSNHFVAWVRSFNSYPISAGFSFAVLQMKKKISTNVQTKKSAISSSIQRCNKNRGFFLCGYFLGITHQIGNSHSIKIPIKSLLMFNNFLVTEGIPWKISNLKLIFKCTYAYRFECLWAKLSIVLLNWNLFQKIKICI